MTLLAFISLPAITVLLQWYGHYLKSSTKLLQKKLVDGNSVSGAAIGSMSTVRAFGAEQLELEEFSNNTNKYLSLNVRGVISYLVYCTFVTSIPSLVNSIVLFYGALLVMKDRSDHITNGQLVTFYSISRPYLMLFIELVLWFPHFRKVLVRLIKYLN